MIVEHKDCIAHFKELTECSYETMTVCYVMEENTTCDGCPLYNKEAQKKIEELLNIYDNYSDKYDEFVIGAKRPNPHFTEEQNKILDEFHNRYKEVYKDIEKTYGVKLDMFLGMKVD